MRTRGATFATLASVALCWCEPAVCVWGETAAGGDVVVEISDGSQTPSASYLESLRASAKDPIDYIVSKFQKHDLVMLGEEHGVRENCLFVASLLEPMYRRAGVRRFATEFVRSRNAERVNRLVTAGEYDRKEAISIMRDYAWPTWGYQEYMDILEAVWRVNTGRPQSNPPLLIVPLDSDWSQHDLFFERTSAKERFEIMLQRERHMSAQLTEQVFASGNKALVHIGYLHSLTNQGERVGTMLRRAQGERVFQVCLHHGFAARGKASAVAQMIERVAGELGREQLGFDVVGTPFAHLRDPRNMAFTYGGKRTFRELAEGYVMLRPLEQLHPVHWIDGFIDDANFKEALEVASKMGQADPGRDNDPAKLNARLKEAIESR
jgi:hypothetical protein